MEPSRGEMGGEARGRQAGRAPGSPEPLWGSAGPGSLTQWSRAETKQAPWSPRIFHPGSGRLPSSMWMVLSLEWKHLCLPRRLQPAMKIPGAGLGPNSAEDKWIASQLTLCVCVSHSAVTPGTVAHQAPLSTGFSRQEHWSGLPFCLSRGSFQHRD